jgi:hypothetical protein
MEAVARFDAEYSTEDVPGGAFAATLGQIRDAHARSQGFGETGEFTLAKKEGDQIVFLLSHRHYDLESPEPIAFASNLAEPMRRALSGESGTVVALDYRGERVLAAYEPVAILDLGIVAKIDLAEIRAPYVNAALLIGGAFSLILVGLVGGATRALNERKQAGEALHRSNTLLQALSEAQSEFIPRLTRRCCLTSF